MYSSNGYRFDFAGHYFHFQEHPGVKTYLENFCRFKKFQRVSKTFLLNRYIPFPVQFHLSHLPSPLRNDIFREIIDNRRSHSSPGNLREFLEIHFGDTLSQLFFKPFLTKYYNTDPGDLAADMDKGSIPVPDKVQVEAGFKGKTFSRAGYNPVIYYPETSLLDFIDNYSRPVKDRIRLDEEVIEIDIDKKKVKTPRGDYSYDTLVSSMPLNRLLGILKPKGRFPAPRLLRHTSTLLVNAVLKRKRKRFHWVYLAEEKFPFYRVGMYAAHPYPACYMERNIIPGTPFDIKKTRDDAVFTLKELKMIETGEEVVHIDARVIPVSYVIFDKNWAPVVPRLLEDLKKAGIYSIGRYGTWNYSYMSNDIAMALNLATKLHEGTRS
jgi:protoporphyrinogen oxidase